MSDSKGTGGEGRDSALSPIASPAAPHAQTINRYSSRSQRLDHAFLRDMLRGATSYKRIAGCFRSSIFELVGEEIGGVPDVRVVCNSDLDAVDSF
ncbi:hypothetical protein [Candidatus Amarolinea aalborgensis]|uniref:hypothetical protein n=1 Tax=Candidatus Amarolinea aalborgensis TaxID=2249329 RepID=UPI003BF9B24A